MEKIEFKGKIIEYTVERKKIKNCYIGVQDGTVKVRVPKKISQEKIEEILIKRADWILKNIEKQKKKVKVPKQYINGENFRVLGKDVTLHISYEKIQKPKVKCWLHKLEMILPLEYQENAKEKVKELVENFYQELAEKEVEKAMKKMTARLKLEPNQYKIKNLKSTWGNCSSTRNISINQKVVMYSPRAIEYVCLHELCHLEHMDHSKMFWDMVQKYMPDYKKAEQELKS